MKEGDIIWRLNEGIVTHGFQLDSVKLEGVRTVCVAIKGSIVFVDMDINLCRSAVQSQQFPISECEPAIKESAYYEEYFRLKTV